MKRVTWLLNSELRRFAARRMVRVLVVGAIAGTAGVLAFLLLRGESVRYPDALLGALGSVGIVMILMSTAVGASAVAAEWNAGSLAGLLLFDTSRVRVLLIRASAVALGCAAMVVIVFVALAGLLAGGAALSGTFEREPELVLADGSEDGWMVDDEGTVVANPDAEFVDVSGEAPLLPTALGTTWRVAVAAALAGVFGVGAGVLVRRTAGVIGGVLISYLIADVAIAALFDAGYFWGPGRALIAVGLGNPEIILALSTPSGPYPLYAVLWTAGVLLAGLLWFSRIEVTTAAR